MLDLLDLRRRRALRRCRDPHLRSFLAAPHADTAGLCAHTEFLAVDLETTGLDAGTDSIISLGWVRVRGLQVVLEEARHIVVNSGVSMNQTAVIHGLTDSEVRAGVSLEAALGVLLPALMGKVMIAHHATVERSFLSAACRQVYGAPLLLRSVDTLQLQQRVMSRSGEPFSGTALRLDSARQRFGLPHYRAHNALSDALACAELFLAQLTAIGEPRRLRLKDVL